MHVINYGEYPQNVSKSQVKREWDCRVANSDARFEGANSLPGDIRWIDYVCNGRDSAEEFIQDNDRGCYDQLAVKFRECEDFSTSKAWCDLNRRLNEEKKKLARYEEEHLIKYFKSKLIGCPKCESKVNKNYVRRFNCPCCGEDLRSTSVKSTVERYKRNIRTLEKKISDEERKLSSKSKNIKWLVKVEWHE